MPMVFDEEEAKKYGLNEAIMIQNLRFWINKNKANNKHYYDGRYWTYNSAEAFSKLFIFWSPSQIRRIIDSLVKKGIVVIGNFNKMKYDRTKWFAFNDENKWLKSAKNSICQNRQMELTKSSNGINEIVKPIPDINTDNNTDIIFVDKKIGNSFDHIEKSFEEFWKLYPRKIAKGKARESYSRALKKVSSDVILQGVKNYLKAIENKNVEEQFIKHPTTWLNQECWEDEYDFKCSQKNDSSSPSRSAKPQGDYVKYDVDDSWDEGEKWLAEYGFTTDEFFEKVDKWRRDNNLTHFDKPPQEIVMKILNREM